jgi:hypothetical protein
MSECLKCYTYALRRLIQFVLQHKAAIKNILNGTVTKTL